MGQLSIYIPTWNRPELLDRLLQTIEPQLTDDVDVFVSVNKSDTEYRFPPWVKYRFLRRNVGGDANICPGPTLVNGRYVWVIGDDEQLEPNAIAVTLEATRHNPGLIIHPDRRHDIRMLHGKTYPNYASFAQDVIANNEGWLLAAHTLISSNTFLRDRYDVAMALQKIDTMYGFHYGMLANILHEPITICPEPTVIYDRQASIFMCDKTLIDEHMSAYPTVIYDIFKWIHACTGYPIPPSCFTHGFDT